MITRLLKFGTCCLRVIIFIGIFCCITLTSNSNEGYNQITKENAILIVNKKFEGSHPGVKHSIEDTQTYFDKNNKFVLEVKVRAEKLIKEDVIPGVNSLDIRITTYTLDANTGKIISAVECR